MCFIWRFWVHNFPLFCPALFSQVAVLAAVLALVVIVIISIIILIAVWRKVSDITSCLTATDLTLLNWNYIVLPAEATVWNQVEGHWISQFRWTRVHLRWPHSPALWPGLGDATGQSGSGWERDTLIHHTYLRVFSNQIFLLLDIQSGQKY